MMEIEPGSVVALKSGSPPMTVISIHGDVAKLCWAPTDGPDTIVEDYLPLNILEVISETDEEPEPWES